MELADRVVLITGGGGGIGRALALAAAEAGARVLVADRDAAAADAVASEVAAREVSGRGFAADVGDAAAFGRLLDDAEAVHGRIDVFCSNAGLLATGGLEVDDAAWQRAWDVNFMAHVVAARRLVPPMLARGGGAFVLTASAAGLLNQVDAAPYAVTKHATVAFAEWLRLTYAHRGLEVVCVCPLGVRTAMLTDHLGSSPLADYLAADAVEPAAVADATLAALREGRFLALPHPQVLDFLRHKTADYDRWLAGMNRLHRSLAAPATER